MQTALPEYFSGQLSASEVRICKQALHTLAEWCHYLIGNHGSKLRPGFINYVNTRLSETLQYLVFRSESTAARV
jgi:hypothetical protein